MTMETILIIDDSPDIRLLLKSILQKRGYIMLTAENGKRVFDWPVPSVWI